MAQALAQQNSLGPGWANIPEPSAGPGIFPLVIGCWEDGLGSPRWGLGWWAPSALAGAMPVSMGSMSGFSEDGDRGS